MHPNTLGRLRRELKSIDPSQSYFAFTLIDRDGRREVSVQSRFAGWPEGRGPGAVELREAAPVKPRAMTKIWDDLRQPWMVVSTREHLYIFLIAGGNALVERSLAELYFPSSVDAHAVIRNGPLGFDHFDPAARAVCVRRPRPRQRQRILERDTYRCQLCGARNDEGAELVLHHIRMFSRGGPTTDGNLITLCKPCHGSLDPHEDITLLFLPGGLFDRALKEETTETHNRGVAIYRLKMSRIAEVAS